MICDLTKMEIANASLLDEGTSAAEAMIMMYNNRSREQKLTNQNKFYVDSNIFPQTLAVLSTRANPLDIELVTGNINEINENVNKYPIHERTLKFKIGFVKYPTSINGEYLFTNSKLVSLIIDNLLNFFLRVKKIRSCTK